MLRAWTFTATTAFPVLPTPRINKVMHDAHDHVLALVRLLDLLHPQSTAPETITTTTITSLLDLELACESLGARALNSFADAVSSGGLCRHPGRCALVCPSDGTSAGCRQLEVGHALATREAHLLAAYVCRVSCAMCM